MTSSAHPWRSAWPAIALATALLLPFLGSAYTIDDPLFLYQARHLLEDPWHPTAFETNWSTAPHRMSALMASGPGMAYLLMPTIALGGSEWLAHLTQLGLLAAALLATAALSLRLGGTEEEARAATLLVATAPAVLGMAGTAMPDVAAMCFGAWGVERAVAWSQAVRWHQAAAATCFLAAATLCRSHLVVLGVVAFAAGLSTVTPRGKVLVLALVPPVAASVVALVALIVTRDPAAPAGAVAGAARTFIFAPAFLRNLVSFFVHDVLVFPLAIPWLMLRTRAIVTRPVFYAATVAAWLYMRSTPEVGPLFAAPLAGLGFAALWDLLADAVARKDRVQGILGAWLLTPLVAVPYLHLPSKYLLAAAPAVGLAVARRLAALPRRRARIVLVSTVAYGAVLGLLIVRADARFAGLGRRAAAELVAPRVAAGKNVWFNGHWGFQWYAERAGARPLTQTPPHPRWGDVVIASLHAEDELMGAMPNKRLVASLVDAHPGGRVMSRALGAGFFSNGWGYLPWWWGDGAVDRYDVWSIEPATQPGP